MDIQSVINQSLLEAENLIKSQILNKTYHIILNRPKQSNAFSLGMYLRLKILLEQAQNDKNINVCVLSSEGKNFSSGNDLANFAQIDLSNKEYVHQFAETLGELLKELTKIVMDFDKPLFCCCSGAVIGFIFPLLGLFDQLYVTKDTYFSAPMIRMAQSLEMFASYTFPRMFGPQKAFEILILGKKLNAEEALTLQFVSKVFEDKVSMMKYVEILSEDLSQMNLQCIKQAKQMLKSQIKEKLWNANIDEINSLKRVWTDPEFANKLMTYMKSINMKSKL